MEQTIEIIIASVRCTSVTYVSIVPTAPTGRDSLFPDISYQSRKGLELRLRKTLEIIPSSSFPAIAKVEYHFLYRKIGMVVSAIQDITLVLSVIA